MNLHFKPNTQFKFDLNNAPEILAKSKHTKEWLIVKPIGFQEAENGELSLYAEREYGLKQYFDFWTPLMIDAQKYKKILSILENAWIKHNEYYTWEKIEAFSFEKTEIAFLWNDDWYRIEELDCFLYKYSITDEPKKFEVEV